MRLNGADCSCYFRCYVSCLNVHPAIYFWLLQLQCRGGPTGVCVVAVAQQVVQARLM